MEYSVIYIEAPFSDELIAMRVREAGGDGAEIYEGKDGALVFIRLRQSWYAFRSADDLLDAIAAGAKPQKAVFRNGEYAAAFPADEDWGEFGEKLTPPEGWGYEE